MKKLSSRHLVIGSRLAVVLGILGLAVVIFQLLVATKPIIATVDPGLTRQQVAAFVAQPVAVKRQWRGFGTAEAIDSAKVPAQVTATVSRIPDWVLEGASVTRGQLLVALDDTDFRNQLQIAQQNLVAVSARLAELDTLENWLTQRLEIEASDLALARDELTRVQDLFRNKAANQKDVDASKRAVYSVQRSKLVVEETLNGIGPRRDQLLAERAGLESSVELAKKNLARCSITSPIDGVIQFVDVEVGESLTLGQRVAYVVNLDRVQVPLSLPAAARRQVRIGDEVELISSGEDKTRWTAKIARIAPQDDASTRTVAVYVEIDQATSAAPGHPAGGPALLVPGMFVSGTVTAGRAQERLIVPRRSIRTGRVVVVIDGLIHSRPVREAFSLEGKFPSLALPDTQWAVLDAGIEPGDTVVLNPGRSLRDGQAVEPSFVGQTATAARESLPEASP